MALDFGGDLFGRNVSEALSPDKDAMTGNWEWIVNNGVTVQDESAALNSSVTMYTVPAGKEFYLVYANLSGKTTADVSGSAEFELDGTLIMTCQLNGDNAHDTISFTPSFPFKIPAGGILKVVSSSASLYCAATLIGYLIDI